MITRKHISRRTVLRGVGTAIALPALEAMVPAFAATSRVGSRAPNRMVFVYVPNGIVMEGWTPASTGRDYEFLRVMKPLKSLRQKLLVLTGLAHNNGRALGDGGGDHARAAATFLTGVHPKKTAGADIRLGLSVDQVAAQAVGKNTRYPSLELGLESGRQAGSCDSGYSCAYTNSLSWRSPTTPNPPEVNPRLVFERLFGDFDPSESAEARARRKVYNKSILDYVLEDTQSLKKDLGAKDGRKLEEYLTSVREIEARIMRVEHESLITPDLEKPAGIPGEFAEHARIMFDLLAVALQTDLTRIATFMTAREGSSRPYREIGISEGHHGLTHHQNKADVVEKVQRINVYHAEQFAYFLRKLDSLEDLDGNTLLDNSMVIYGSGLSDGNRHEHHNLPVLLAGGAAGTVRTGLHLRFPPETPMTNLYLAMLDRMGVRTDLLGDSTGRLQHLSDLS